MARSNDNYRSQFKSGVWYELEKFPLQQQDFLKVLGHSEDWIHPDFNPDGTRECFINGDLGWTSARYVDHQDCYIEDTESSPTHFMIIPSIETHPIKGSIKIRKGNKNQEPKVVFVAGFGKIGYWICNAINTGETFFSNEEDLIDYDFTLFEKMVLGWRIWNADMTKKRLEKHLKKLQNDQK
ncbi:hypothetical protein [Flavobacterium sp. FlaQc-50]|uniref:hypothetical protein n=1 Tax=unclassified Flavobacterium TaxID=196869 RepID=UPI0037583CE8